ncbi:MAG: hypothetical protein ABR875_01065 [Minisyncoccia bacterium]|jgi:hypothetical protein
MRKWVILSFALFVFSGIVVARELAADEQSQAKPAQATTVKPANPHSIFKFDQLPDPDYYKRIFVLNLKPGVRDLTKEDSDFIIHTYPQSNKGFLTGWLQPGQAIGTLPEDVIVTMVDGTGDAVIANLKKNESVLFDNSGLISDEGDRQILAVIRCGNKVIKGYAKPVIKEVQETIEEPVFEIKKQVTIVEQPVFEIQKKVIVVEQPEFQTQKKIIPITQPAEKRGWSTKKKVIVGVLIGGLVGGGVFLGEHLCCKEKSETIVPSKTWVPGQSPAGFFSVTIPIK